MKKGLKIFLCILACILTVLVVTFLIYFIDYSSLPEMDVQEVPLGMEWGMTRKEVEDILAQHPEYSFNKYETMLVYNVVNYQGIDHLSGQTVFRFDESGGLCMVYYMFRSTDAENGMSTSDALKLGYKSTRKQFRKHYEAPHIFATASIKLFSISGGDNWIGEESFVSTNYEEADKFYMVYEPIESNQEFVDMLQDPFAE